MHCLRCFFLFFLIILLTDCTKKDIVQDLVLPADTALDFPRYALVIEPYVTFRDKPSDDGISSSHAREGDVFEIDAIKVETQNDRQVLWVKLKDAGWISSSFIYIYSTKEKAVTASKKLK